MNEKRNRREDQVRVRQYSRSETTGLSALLDFIRTHKGVSLAMFALISLLINGGFQLGLRQDTTMLSESQATVEELRGRLDTLTKSNSQLSSNLAELHKQQTAAQADLQACKSKLPHHKTPLPAPQPPGAAHTSKTGKQS
jgi:hypothetical protein